MDRTLPLFLLLALSFSQLSAIVYKQTMLKPVITLNMNQVKGLIIIECKSTTIDAAEANAANTLM